MRMSFLGFEKLGKKEGWQAWESIPPKAAGFAVSENVMRNAQIVARSVGWVCGGLVAECNRFSRESTGMRVVADFFVSRQWLFGRIKYG
jgi:hypothetical protein